MEVWDILTDMILIEGNLHKINDDDVTPIFLLSLIFTDFVLFFHKDYAIPINNLVEYLFIYLFTNIYLFIYKYFNTVTSQPGPN